MRRLRAGAGLAGAVIVAGVLAACGDVGGPTAGARSTGTTSTFAPSTTTTATVPATTTSTAPATTTTTTAAATVSSVPAIPMCQASQLSGSDQKVMGTGPGHEPYLVTLTNDGGTCTLYGYPGIGGIGADGQPVTLSSQPVGPPDTEVYPSVGEETVTLANGQRAVFSISYNFSSTTQGRITLEVTPPTTTTQLLLPGTVPDQFSGNVVGVSPIAPAGSITRHKQ